MEAGLGQEMMRSIKRGMALGIDGLRDDDVAVVTPWGFDVADMSIPLTARPPPRPKPQRRPATIRGPDTLAVAINRRKRGGACPAAGRGR